MKVFVDEIVKYSGDKHYVDQGRNKREENLEDEDVRQSKQAHGAVFGDGALVFEDGLEDAEGPAEALADEAIGVDRGLGKCERAVFVDHAVALLEEVHGEIGVFGYGVGVVASAGLHRGGPPGSDCSPDHHHYVEEI